MRFLKSTQKFWKTFFNVLLWSLLQSLNLTYKLQEYLKSSVLWMCATSVKNEKRS